MKRLHDPVWQAFEQDPPPDAPAMTEEQARLRKRGLEQMRKGMFVDVQTRIKRKSGR